MLLPLALVAAFTILVRWLGLHVIFPALGPPGGVLVLAIQFGLIAIALRLGGIRLADLGWVRARWTREVAAGLAGMLAISAGLLAFGGHASETLSTIAGFSLGERARFAAIGIQAALAEETIFRGWLQGALTPRTGLAAAIAITAAVFALSHLSLAPARLVGLCWIGVVLGVLRGGRRPLWAPAIAHAVLWAAWGDA